MTIKPLGTAKPFGTTQMGKAWKEGAGGPHADEVRLSLGILAQYTGEQAAALLLIVEALARNHLISAAEFRRLC